MSTLGNNLFAAYWTQHQYEIPEDGLVFWHPLDSLYATTPTGDAMTYASELTDSRVTKIGKIPCIDLTGNITTTMKSITTSGVIDIEKNTPLTMSIWINPIVFQTNSDTVLYFGQHPYSSRTMVFENNNVYHYLTSFRNNNDVIVRSQDNSVLVNTWTHICGTMDVDFNNRLYINGRFVAETLATTSSRKNPLDTQQVAIGCSGRNSQASYLWFNGYVASARIYNRVLTDKEIMALAHEF